MFRCLASFFWNFSILNRGDCGADFAPVLDRQLPRLIPPESPQRPDWLPTPFLSVRPRGNMRAGLASFRFTASVGEQPHSTA